MSDAFFTVAHTSAGPSCFFVFRFTPDGAVNSFALQRLKDKLGNRDNASSEIEFRDTSAILVGEEGRGIPTILESADLTWLDFAVGSAGLIRAALSQTLHHATVRKAFAHPLTTTGARLQFQYLATGVSSRDSSQLSSVSESAVATSQNPRWGAAAHSRDRSASMSAITGSPITFFMPMLTEGAP